MIEKTAMSGPLFVLGALVVFTVFGRWAWLIWKKYVRRLDQAQAGFMKGSTPPGPIGPILATLMIVTVYVVGVALAWSTLQKQTTTMSSYQNPAEVAEQKGVRETTTPTVAEIEAKREAQKEKTEVKPHNEAISSFDESMEREAEKIRKRSEQKPTDKQP